MTYEGDPYRVLGITPGATLNEVKSAYRRLVKQWHPDTAGERALPRFLAIQAAYERLVDGEGRLRSGRAARGGARPAGPGPGPGGGGPAAGGRRGEPWRADAERARASRDAWRARRAGWSTGSTSGSSSAGGGWAAGGSAGSTASGPAGRGEGVPRGEGAAGRGDGASRERASRERRGHHRTTRKATPGSTSYDEAAEPLDPRWGGATWYGASSGTYWTINPREYADPRKHGPEYLARARRAAGVREGDADAAEGPATADEPATPDTDAAGGDWGWSAESRTRTQGDPHDWGARGWSYESSAAGGATGPAAGSFGPGAGSFRASPGERRRTSGDTTAHGPDRPAPADTALPDLEDLVRRAFPSNLQRLAARPGHRWRLALAFVGWPPLGYAAATLADAVTGCGTFSADCAAPLDLAAVAVQPVLVALLIVVPGLAAAAAFAALAALVVALLAAFALALVAPVAPDLARTVLVAVVAVAWLAAFAGPTMLRRRADRR